jgi:hypothetical protein
METVEAKGLLERRITPVVLLAATPKSDAMAVDHGFPYGIIDILRPLLCLNEETHLQIGKDQSDIRFVTVRRFSCRLHTASTLVETPSSVRSQIVGAEMRACAQDELSKAQQDLIPLLAKIAAATVELPHHQQKGVDLGALRQPMLTQQEAGRLVHGTFPAWWPQFTADYCSMLRFSYMDTIDHPQAVLFTVIAAESSSFVITDLRATEAAVVQPLYQATPSADPNVFRVVLLFHDVSTGLTDAAVNEQRRMIMEKFSPQGICHIVKFDSRVRQDPAAPVVDPAFWVATNEYMGYRVDSLQRSIAAPTVNLAASVNGSQQGRGPRMPQQFFSELHTSVQHVLRSFLVTHLPRTLRDTRDFIEQNRQSLTDRIATFFGKKETRPQREPFQYRDKGDPQYWHHSIEMSLRRAGDLSFMLHDYDGALSYYKLCRDELESKLRDRPWNKNLLAAAVEGIGVAQIMVGKAPLPFDVRAESKLELAKEQYSRNEVHSHAFRTALLLVSICRVRMPPANEKAKRVLEGMLTALTPPLYRAMQFDQLAYCCLIADAPFPGALGHPDGVILGISKPHQRPVPQGYSPQCAPRKFAQLSLNASMNYGNTHVAPSQDEHALRCALQAWTVMKLRSVRTYPALCRAVLRAVIRGYKHLGMTQEALERSVELCRSGCAHHSDYQELLSHVRAHLLTLTDWSPSATGTFSVGDGTTTPPAAPFGRATPQPALTTSPAASPRPAGPSRRVPVAPVLGLPIVQVATAMVEGTSFVADDVTLSEEDVLGVPPGEFGAADVGRIRTRSFQAWDNTLDVLRRAVATTRVTVPRSIAHHRLNALVDATNARKLLNQHGNDALDAASRAHVFTVTAKRRLAFSVMLTNPLQNAPLYLTDIALLTAPMPSAPAAGAAGKSPAPAVDGTVATDQLDATTNVFELAEGQPLSLEPRASRTITIPINTSREGTFVFVGLRWTVDGVRCDTYFAACPPFSAQGYHTAFDDALSAASVAIARRGVPLDHAHNFRVTVTPEEPVLSIALDPPLPSAVRDGELVTTALVVTNNSPSASAQHVRVLFNKCCYHLLAPRGSEYTCDTAPSAFSPSYGNGAPLTVGSPSTAPELTIEGRTRDWLMVAIPGTLAAGENVRLPLMFRAEGGWSTRAPAAARGAGGDMGNSFGYAAAAGGDSNSSNFLSDSPLLPQGSGGAAPNARSAMNTVMALALWTPAMPAGARPSHAASLPVHLGKYLRRVRVNRALQLSSVVLPPTSADLPITMSMNVENTAAPAFGASTSMRRLPSLPPRAAGGMAAAEEGAGAGRSPIIPPPPGSNPWDSPQQQQTNPAPENSLKVVRVTALSNGFSVVALNAASVKGAQAHVPPASRIAVPLCATLLPLPPPSASMPFRPTSASASPTPSADTTGNGGSPAFTRSPAGAVGESASPGATVASLSLEALTVAVAAQTSNTPVLARLRAEQHCVTALNTLHTQLRNNSTNDDAANANSVAEFEGLFGTTVAGNACLMHFASTAATAGALAVDCEPPLDDGLAFYTDTQESKEFEAQRRAELQAKLERERLERERLAPLVPLLFAVAWRTCGGGGNGHGAMLLSGIEPGSPAGNCVAYASSYGISFHAVDAATTLRKISMLQRPAFDASPYEAYIAVQKSRPLLHDTGSLMVTAEGLSTVAGSFARESRFGAAAVTGRFDVVLTNATIDRLAVRTSIGPVFGSAIMAHPSFMFVGQTTHALTIEPRGTARIELRPVFFGPGVYNVSCLQVTAKALPATAGATAGGASAAPVNNVVVTGTDQAWLVTVVSRAAQAAEAEWESPVRPRPLERRRTVTMSAAALCAAADATYGAASPLRHRGASSTNNAHERYSSSSAFPQSLETAGDTASPKRGASVERPHQGLIGRMMDASELLQLNSQSTVAPPGAQSPPLRMQQQQPLPVDATGLSPAAKSGTADATAAAAEDLQPRSFDPSVLIGIGSGRALDSTVAGPTEPEDESVKATTAATGMLATRNANSNSELDALLGIASPTAASPNDQDLLAAPYDTDLLRDNAANGGPADAASVAANDLPTRDAAGGDGADAASMSGDPWDLNATIAPAAQQISALDGGGSGFDLTTGAAVPGAAPQRVDYFDDPFADFVTGPSSITATTSAKAAAGNAMLPGVGVGSGAPDFDPFATPPARPVAAQPAAAPQAPSPLEHEPAREAAEAESLSIQPAEVDAAVDEAAADSGAAVNAEHEDRQEEPARLRDTPTTPSDSDDDGALVTDASVAADDGHAEAPRAAYAVAAPRHDQAMAEPSGTVDEQSDETFEV